MHSKFDLYTMVEKNQSGITFWEADSLIEVLDQLEEDKKGNYVRVYDRKTDISFEELTKMNDDVMGIWYVSVINDDGQHIGYEFTSAKEVKRVYRQLLENTYNKEEGYALIYPPYASLVDIEALKIQAAHSVSWTI